MNKKPKHMELKNLKTVKNRDGSQEGRVISAGHRCTLAGCTGQRVHVRWPDGKLTKPCSKGLHFESETVARIK